MSITGLKKAGTEATAASGARPRQHWRYSVSENPIAAIEINHFTDHDAALMINANLLTHPLTN
ncbi:MAG: hypothetical protein ACE37N_07400 [Pseudohongiellaceae bacterium]